MATKDGERPDPQTVDSTDQAPQLSGLLTANGVAELRPAAMNGNHLKPPLESTDSRYASSFEDEEDYDSQKIDTAAVIEGSRGGSLELEVMKDEDANGQKPPLHRRQSIPVRLEKTEKKGRYMLTADDPEIREILRQGLQRRKANSAEKRGSLRELVFTRRFTQFDRLNPSNTESPFHGFFTLFWICMIGMLANVIAHNYRSHGNIFGRNELLRMMFKRDVVVLGLTDGVMCLTTIFGLFLQRLVSKDYISWASTGWIIQNIWQTFYLFAFIGWTFYREWPWTHTILIVLHSLVFVMKQHSYAFYNGYLSQVYKRKGLLERQLREIDLLSPASSPNPQTSPQSPFFSGSQWQESSPGALRDRRRQSAGGKASNLSYDSPEISSVFSAIDSGEALGPEQMTAFSNIIKNEIETLSQELKGKCSLTKNYYPNNLTVWDFTEWTLFPTLVYELEYPRQEKINWLYVAEKTAATFGVIAVMQVISQAYIYPAVKETVRMKEAGMTLQERWNEFPLILTDMLMPLLLEQLLTWYVIWECILNVLAELTRFADRGFYGPWWNSVSWDQYARDWNRPVHNFLLRHVYHSSISAFQLSKSTATFVTFLLSALVHELIMFCLFKKVRGYLFTMQLLQMPLVALSRTKLLKGRTTIGNAIFWVGLFVGPSLVTSLYLVV